MARTIQQMEISLKEGLDQLITFCSINPEDSSYLILKGGNSKTFARLFTKFYTKH